MASTADTLRNIQRCLTTPCPARPTGKRLGDLVYPPFGYSAVVEGAVRFLLQPQTIARRVSNLTYGFRVYDNWVPGMPDEPSFKKYDPQIGSYVTDKAFKVAVRRGDSINVSGPAGQMMGVALSLAVWELGAAACSWGARCSCCIRCGFPWLCTRAHCAAVLSCMVVYPAAASHGCHCKKHTTLLQHHCSLPTHPRYCHVYRRSTSCTNTLLSPAWTARASRR